MIRPGNDRFISLNLLGKWLIQRSGTAKAHGRKHPQNYSSQKGKPRPPDHSG